MKVLVCGGRDFKDESKLTETLDKILISLIGPDNEENVDMCIVHGGAPGADTLAGIWARSRGIADFQCDANWLYYGKAGGPIRNKWMLRYMRPHLVVAFPGGNGTANMIQQAKDAGIEVMVVA